MNDYGIFNLSDFTNAGDAVLAFFTKQSYQMLFDKMGLLSDALHGTIAVFLSIVVVIYGTLFILNKVDSTKDDLLKMALITMVVAGLSPGNYFSFIVLPVSQVSNGLTIFLSDSGAATPFAAVHDVFFEVFAFGTDLMDEGGMTDFAPIFIGGLVCLLFGAVYALFAIALVFSSFMLAINFMFGFILIKLCIFKTWRPVFKTWFQSVLKFAMVPVVATVITVFGAELVNEAMMTMIEVRRMTADSDIQDISTGFEFWVTMITGGVTLYALTKVLEVTAELTGSVATDMSGSTRAAAGASVAAARGASVAAARGGKLAYKKWKG